MFHVPLKWFQFTESKIFLSVEEMFDLDFVFTFFLFESITNYLALIVRKIIVRPKVNFKA